MHFFIALILAFSFSCGKKTKTKTILVDGVPAPGDPIGPVPPPVGAEPGFVSFQAFESENLADATGLNSAKQENTFFLTLCDQLNAEGRLEPALKRGVEKAVNSISDQATINPGTWIGENKCTLRLDLRDYGLDQRVTLSNGQRIRKWRIIELNEPLQFESFTDRGILLKQLTQTRRPWMLATSFMETVLNDNVYYALLGIPNNLQDFLTDTAGCNLQRDFDDFENIYLAGVRRSRIALQKGRSVYITECDNGAFAGTYDVILEDVTSAGRNLSINPFPAEARTNNTFQHDASEFIYSLENGLLGFSLYNAAGLRETFAPTNIVIDPDRAGRGIDATISNARSCSSCHSSGFLEVDDFLAEHCTGNPNFSADEIQKCQAYFGRNEGMDAAIRQANNEFAANLADLGIDISNVDPINEVTDKIREEMVISKVAGMLFMRAEEFQDLLRQSPGGLQAIGQLINGDTINFQEFIQVAGGNELRQSILVGDLNLFQEGLGQ